MNNLLKTIGILATLSVLVAPAYAIDARKNIGDMQEKAGSRPGLLRKAFDFKGRAAIGTCAVTGIVDATITCMREGKTYTVVTDSKTQFRRRFWGKATVEDIQVGHEINVVGSWADDAQTSVLARLVRDTSIQKRFGVFFGTVKSLTSTGWVMDTINRGSQTVTVSSSTKIVNRKGDAVAQADIVVGHKVRIRGLWDNKANTVTEVKEVKDFNVPIKPTPTPTP